MMAGISTTIQLYDRVSAPIYKMLGALGNLTDAFESVETSMNGSFDTSKIESSRKALEQASLEVIQLGNDIQNNTGKQDKFNKKVRDGASDADGLTEKIMGMVGAYASIQGVQKLVNLSDEYTQTTARLSMIVDVEEGGNVDAAVEGLQSKIFTAAQNSRASYADTADMVAKISMRTGGLFSNDEAVVFAENLNKLYTIAGASQEEMKSSQLQLTQALGSGALRGEEFNAVFEAAPNVMQQVADYMGEPIGKLREMAADGQITADIVKNALLSIPKETQTAFKNMPMTWSQVWTSITNRLYMASQPILEFISMLADNWATLEPIILGVATAIGICVLALMAYMAVTKISAFWSAVSAAFNMLHAKSVDAQTKATFAQTVAQHGLNAALLASPITWIVIAIAAVIAAIVIWIKKVGGLKVWWLIVVNAILTAWDWVKIGFFTGVYWVIDLWNNLMLKIKTFSTNIANFMGDMKVNVLMILQNMVNGGIDIINDFINMLNKIPGVSIDTISHVSFGTQAQLENEAAKQARNEELENYKAEIEAGIAEREASLEKMKADATAATATRQAEISAAKEEAAKEETTSLDNETTDNIAATAENTGKAADALDITSEDLKYMRDIAEKDVINRFTTAEIKVEMTNNNNVTSDMDLDGIVDYLTTGVNEAMEKAAEGVHY